MIYGRSLEHTVLVFYAKSSSGQTVFTQCPVALRAVSQQYTTAVRIYEIVNQHSCGINLVLRLGYFVMEPMTKDALVNIIDYYLKIAIATMRRHEVCPSP